MEIQKATTKEADEVTFIVSESIRAIYPKFYPVKVVDFFLELHNKEHVLRDINANDVWMFYDKDQAIGTGSYHGNHITRVYVKPEYQRMGYGTRIMKFLEEKIFKSHQEIVLDASLPASFLYEKLGYHSFKRNQISIAEDAVLVYEEMKKEL